MPYPFSHVYTVFWIRNRFPCGKKPARWWGISLAVCRYLQPADDAPQLFSSLAELEGLGRRPLSSEQDLEIYERFAVEDHVHDVIEKLCEIPDARREFQLGSGIQFDNHTNVLDEDEDGQSEASNPQRPRPDQFCIHRVDGSTNSLLTTVEYKPPHKLSVESLRAGLRPMNFWQSGPADTIPTDAAEKLRHNAERLAGSAIIQEYHVMIQEGLEYSYVTIGLARVLLRVPYDDPSTLYYCLCEPKLDANAGDGHSLLGPNIDIGGVLCLCLMSFRSPPRATSHGGMLPGRGYMYGRRILITHVLRFLMRNCDRPRQIPGLSLIFQVPNIRVSSICRHPPPH